MWLFSGKKSDCSSAVIEQAVSDIVNKHSYCRQQHNEFEKYLQYNLEDERLSLCDEKIKILKKTLFYHTAANVQTKDFDIFAVSWDVEDLTEPPDDISPLLPPETWGEPDIVCIGLQNCEPRTAALWSVVINHSMQIYSPSFVSVTPDQDNDEVGENLLFIFIREELTMFVHDYSSLVTNTTTQFKPDVAGVRFGFHETSLCFICGRIEDVNGQKDITDDVCDAAGSPTQNHGDKMPDLSDTMAREAYARQRFENLLNHVEFTLGEGNNVSASEHPLIVWTGLKDYHERSRREALSVACSILASRQSEVANENSVLFSGTDEVVDQHFRNMATLSNHKLDVRYSPVTLVGPPKSAYFASTVNNLYRTNNGSVSVIKAGMMRLVLEILNKSNQLTPRESTAELMLLRHAIPVISQEEMDTLFQSTLTALRISEPQGFNPQVIIDPPVIHLDQPLKPWHSFVTSVRIENASGEYPIPIPFEVCCLSSSRNILLAGQLGDKPTAHIGSKRDDGFGMMFDSDTMHVMPASARGESSLRSTFGLELPRIAKVNDLGYSGPTPSLALPNCAASGGHQTHRKKAGWKKFAEKNLSPAWLLQSNRGPGISKKSATATYDCSPIEEGKCTSKGKRKKGGLISGILGAKKDKARSPSERPTVGDDEPIEHHFIKRQASGPAHLDCHAIEPEESPSESFHLTKWLSVEPQAGAILPGKCVTVTVQIFIQEPISEIIESPDPLVLVIRMPEIKKDYFVAIEVPRIQTSLYGLDMERLAAKGATPLAPSEDLDVPEQLPLQISPCCSASADGANYPMPKELWHLLKFIRTKVACPAVTQHCLNSSNSLNSWKCSRAEEEPCDFCLPVFLQRAGDTVCHMMPRLRQEMDTVLTRVEQHKQIPPEISIDAALMVLSLWAQSVESSIIPREYIAELSDTHTGADDSHLVCRATLLSLPVWSRNFCLTLVSVLKELVRHHFICTVPALRHGVLVESPPLESPNGNSDNPDTGDSHASADSKSEAYLMEALALWVASFLITDSSSKVGVNFVKHLLAMSDVVPAVKDAG